MIHALNTKMVTLLSPASQSAAATRSAFVDMLGVDYATINIQMAAEVNTSGIGPTIVLGETDATNVATATWHSDCTLTAHPLVAANQATFHVNGAARKRYIKLLITAETTTNDHVTAAASAILSRRAAAPAGTAGLTDSTNDAVRVLT